MPDALLQFVLTPDFEACLAEIPMTDEDLRQVQAELVENPDAGDMVPGTGGVRKIRVAVRGKGKRGGARVLYFYAVRQERIYLLFAYAKGDVDDLSPAGKRMLKGLAARIAQA